MTTGTGTGPGPAAALTAAELTLPPWEDGDAAALPALLADPEIHRWTSHRPLRGRGDALRWLAAEHAGRATGARLGFALLAHDRLAGHVVLKRPGGTGGTGGTGEVGYWTGAAARGRGLATRAVALLSAWALDPCGELGLTRLELVHNAGNPASCRVAEKAGYRLESLLPPRPPHPQQGHLHTLTRPS
ncbi:GNAT family N-acetyltransferase [Kitasatospora phosalacinea]|uniref:Acetyltransferase n=1 Tax=Kitasatospora phosalacinea TaxID=2065 RepID=A0A9W6UKT6_9ACTN|nr:GNAT family N-acetyltransferase [Kitasatospora phosalacinea]GLW53726.1 acetyltransferase [Kitasatospora phosalacinea]